MNRELIKWIVISSLMLGVILLSVYKGRMIRRDGIITLAKVDKFETNASGGDMFITIFYKNKQYKTVANTLCYYCIGKYYFVKVLDRDPASYFLLLDDYKVPECISTKPIPYTGWMEIPKCE